MPIDAHNEHINKNNNLIGLKQNPVLGHLQLDLILLESTRFKPAAEMAAELSSIAIL
jgi:hypothetical protein